MTCTGRACGAVTRHVLSLPGRVAEVDRLAELFGLSGVALPLEQEAETVHAAGVAEFGRLTEQGFGLSGVAPPREQDAEIVDAAGVRISDNGGVRAETLPRYGCADWTYA